MIAFERPPPAPDQLLTIGIAGRGFDGNLTSDSTRMRGYVISTDLAPTILRHLATPVPDEMEGSRSAPRANAMSGRWSRSRTASPRSSIGAAR